VQEGCKIRRTYGIFGYNRRDKLFIFVGVEVFDPLSRRVVANPESAEILTFRHKEALYSSSLCLLQYRHDFGFEQISQFFERKQNFLSTFRVRRYFIGMKDEKDARSP